MAVPLFPGPPPDRLPDNSAMQAIRTVFLSLTAVALALGFLWLTHRQAHHREINWEQVQAEARRGGYRLITTPELSRLYLETPGSLLLVDTRQEWEYRTGHIEGAVNFPLEPTWWARWRAQGPFKALLGPDPDRVIVFY